MTAGFGAVRPAPGRPDDAARAYFEHSTAPRVNTDSVIAESLRREYPNLHLIVVPQVSANILVYAAAGHAAVAPIDKEHDRLSWRSYVPPASRLTGKGVLADTVKIGKYLVDWKKKEFVMYVVEGRDGDSSFPIVTNQYILSSSVEATNTLLLEAGQFGSLLHDEVWVFDGGYWQKSKELWDSVRKAHWEDVILEPGKKKTIKEDVRNFFDQTTRETYERLKVPWKRGIIYYGPPGNGKTISIKATMHDLYDREEPVPTLYVRTLVSFQGPEFSLGQIFSLARRTAPCLLVFEDLDSIVSDEVRSYFLNEVDGIKKNDGILIIGSTNHLERLDPGIVKRPSRFDRKYFFDNPNEEERTAYMKYWQGKLADNETLDFPDKICPAVAKITQGFSFAYLQEAMVASLLAIARDEDGLSERTCLECLETHSRPTTTTKTTTMTAITTDCDQKTTRRAFEGLYDFIWEVKRLDDDDRDLDNYVLWREIKKQVRILREEMSDEKNSSSKVRRFS